MQTSHRYQQLATHQLLAAYLFAGWHVRRMPAATPEHRLQRAAWCRDHCNDFAGRWYALGAAAWFVQISPIGLVLSPAGVPFLGALFLVAFAIGVRHTVWQVRAQQQAGLPPVEPPADMSELRRPARRSKPGSATEVPARPVVRCPRHPENAPPDGRLPPESR